MRLLEQATVSALWKLLQHRGHIRERRDSLNNITNPETRKTLSMHKYIHLNVSGAAVHVPLASC